jgi:ADP-ribose pyrophosphatase YjhB (NUDIX family)
MELGETVIQGAARETREEAGAEFEMGKLFTLMNVTRVGQVHFFYRAQLTSERFDPGHETQEAKLFTEDEVPWDALAFRTVKETLRLYFADAKLGHFGMHQINID